LLVAMLCVWHDCSFVEQNRLEEGVFWHHCGFHGAFDLHICNAISSQNTELTAGKYSVQFGSL
jgi:hypothetical protein